MVRRAIAKYSSSIVCSFLSLWAAQIAWAQTPVEPVYAQPKANESIIRQKPHREAIDRGLDLLRESADRYPASRECFSCHHQTIPLLAMSLTRRRDHHEAGNVFSDIDTDRVEEITRFTQASFGKQIDRLRAGEPIDGKALVVGYGLWTLEMANVPRSELTDAMVENLIRTQESDGHWAIHSYRPPAASSEFMATAVAMNGILHYGIGYKPTEEIRDVVYRAMCWMLLADEPKTTEDWLGLAWGAYEFQQEMDSLKPLKEIVEPPASYGGGQNRFEIWLSAQEDKSLRAKVYSRLAKCDIRFVQKQLLRLQNSDGGWGQLPGNESDAYSTGFALVMLSQISNNYKTSIFGSREYKRGIEYLIRSQLPDGSWHIVSRSNPVQEYFDNGDPHDTDQFISIMGTGWATAALLNAWSFELWPLHQPTQVANF